MPVSKLPTQKSLYGFLLLCCKLCYANFIWRRKWIHNNRVMLRIRKETPAATQPRTQLCQAFLITWLRFGSISFGYTKLGWFLPKSDHLFIRENFDFIWNGGMQSWKNWNHKKNIKTKICSFNLIFSIKNILQNIKYTIFMWMVLKI